MSDPIFPYRLVPYGTGWQIERWTVTPKKNPVTGRPNKNAGKAQWRAFKWPGTLRSAADQLVSLIMQDSAEQGIVNADDLVLAVNDAIERAEAILAEWREQTNNVGPKSEND